MGNVLSFDEKKVVFSDFEDPVGHTAKAAIERSKFAEEFQKVLSQVVKKSSSHETVHVGWWYAPFIYIEVKDNRWKHYPCGWRFCISFDLTNGKLASSDSANRYAFARKGWQPFAHTLTDAVAHYTDCGNFNSESRC